MELRHLRHFVARRRGPALHPGRPNAHGVPVGVCGVDPGAGAGAAGAAVRAHHPPGDAHRGGAGAAAEAERILAQVRSAHEAVAAVQGVLRGTLSLGTEQCIAGVRVAALLAVFRRHHPDVEIRLRQAGSQALADEVAAGRLDLAFAYRTREDGEHLRSVSLAGEPMTLLCHPGHPLVAAGPAVTPHRLAREVFVDFHPGWGPRRATDAAFAAAGVRRAVTLEVNDVHGLLDLVDENLGVAAVPAHFRHKRTSLAAVPLADTGGAVYETVALLPSEQATSPAARALMALLEAQAREAA